MVLARITCLAGLMSSLLCLPRVAAGDQTLALVASPTFPGDGTISMAQLHRLYLGRTTRISGVAITPLDLPPGSAPRRAFGLSVLERTEEQLEDYWVEQALRGGRLPPQEAGDVAALLRRVASEPAAVGYAPADALPDSGVRILRLRVGGRTLGPDDSDYPIRLRSADDGR